MAYEILTEKSYTFSVRVVKMYKHLQERKQEYGLGNQVFRSGTSICANISEAVYGQSTADNISKLSIALKEANETRYWLNLLADTDYITKEQRDSMVVDCEELIKMLTTAVKTLKTRSV